MKLLKTLKNFWIDMSIQRAFLGGRVISIDGREVTYDTVSTSYDIAELIFFKYYPVRENDVIVDVGCGKGRVFNYLLYKGLKNRMVGYEINYLVADKTKMNLSRYKNVEIIGGNIFDDFPDTASIYYLFNPFKQTMMRDFKAKILEMKEKKPVILYYNPTCLDVFDDGHFLCELVDIPISFFGLPYKLAIIRLA